MGNTSEQIHIVLLDEAEVIDAPVYHVSKSAELYEVEAFVVVAVVAAAAAIVVGEEDRMAPVLTQHCLNNIRWASMQCPFDSSLLV